MLTGTFPIATELQVRPRALKRAVNPPMTPGATEQRGSDRALSDKRPDLSPVGNADTIKGPILILLCKLSTLHSVRCTKVAQELFTELGGERLTTFREFCIHNTFIPQR